jgi:hypothetical protein
LPCSYCTYTDTFSAGPGKDFTYGSGGGLVNSFDSIHLASRNQTLLVEQTSNIFQYFNIAMLWRKRFRVPNYFPGDNIFWNMETVYEVMKTLVSILLETAIYTLLFGVAIHIVAFIALPLLIFYFIPFRPKKKWLKIEVTRSMIKCTVGSRTLILTHTDSEYRVRIDTRLRVRDIFGKN